MIDPVVTSLIILSVVVLIIIIFDNEQNVEYPRRKIYVTPTEKPEIIAKSMNIDAKNNKKPELQKINKVDKKEELLPEKGDFDIDMYQGKKTMQELFPEMGCSADTRITNRMKYMGMQPQLASVIRSSYNKYSLQPFIEEELREHAKRTWWDSDFLDNEF